MSELEAKIGLSNAQRTRRAYEERRGHASRTTCILATGGRYRVSGPARPVARNFRRHQSANLQHHPGERDRIAARRCGERGHQLEWDLVRRVKPWGQHVPRLVAEVTVVITILLLRRYGFQIA